MPSADLFETVDDYIDGLFVSGDQVLQNLVNRARAAGLPDIEVSPGQGLLLYLLARLVGAGRILEVGALGGYSSVWLARGLPASGTLTTLEVNPDYAAFARETFRLAGLDDVCRVIEGPASETLRGLPGPFDLVFLDANKDDYPLYLSQAARLLRPGGLLLADNVIRKGAVIAPAPDDPMAKGAAEFNRQLAAHPDFESIAMQQIGRKGHDGLALARKRT